MSTTNNNKPETQTTDSSDSVNAASVVTQSAERNVAIGPQDPTAGGNAARAAFAAPDSVGPQDPTAGGN